MKKISMIDLKRKSNAIVAKQEKTKMPKAMVRKMNKRGWGE